MISYPNEERTARLASEEYRTAQETLIRLRLLSSETTKRLVALESACKDTRIAWTERQEKAASVDLATHTQLGQEFFRARNGETLIHLTKAA